MKTILKELNKKIQKEAKQKNRESIYDSIITRHWNVYYALRKGKKYSEIENTEKTKTHLNLAILHFFEDQFGELDYDNYPSRSEYPYTIYNNWFYILKSSFIYKLILKEIKKDEISKEDYYPLLIKYISKSTAFSKLLRRHIFVLNNYKKEKKLSLIEKTNHQDNLVRCYYLKEIGKLFNIEVDLKSELFDRPLNEDKHGIYFDYLDFLKRLFKRIDYLESKGIPVTKQNFISIVKSGNYSFNPCYGLHKDKELV